MKQRLSVLDLIGSAISFCHKHVQAGGAFQGGAPGDVKVAAAVGPCAFPIPLGDAQRDGRGGAVERSIVFRTEKSIRPEPVPSTARAVPSPPGLRHDVAASAAQAGGLGLRGLDSTWFMIPMRVHVQLKVGRLRMNWAGGKCQVPSGECHIWNSTLDTRNFRPLSFFPQRLAPISSADIGRFTRHSIRFLTKAIPFGINRALNTTLYDR